RAGGKGEKLLAFSLTEPGSGSDSGAVHTSAEPHGDGWQLTGTKLYVSNGREASTVIVMAATDARRGANGGVTAFLVDTDRPGFRVGRCEKKMGLHGSSTAELVLDHVEVGPEHVLGEVGKGFHVAMTALDVGRVSLGAASLGAIEMATTAALDYAKNRTQFGCRSASTRRSSSSSPTWRCGPRRSARSSTWRRPTRTGWGTDPTGWSRLERAE
ncbi:butyryl-CoA dehydrogenase, partial [mine drainage metagenome]